MKTLKMRKRERKKLPPAEPENLPEVAKPAGEEKETGIRRRRRIPQSEVTEALGQESTASGRLQRIVGEPSGEKAEERRLTRNDVDELIKQLYVRVGEDPELSPYFDLEDFSDQYRARHWSVQRETPFYGRVNFNFGNFKQRFNPDERIFASVTLDEEAGEEVDVTVVMTKPMTRSRPTEKIEKKLSAKQFIPETVNTIKQILTNLNAL